MPMEAARETSAHETPATVGAACHQQRRHGTALRLDPRTKLCFLLLANVLLFLHCAPVIELALVGVVLVAYLLSEKRHSAVTWCAVYLGMWAIDQLTTPVAQLNPVLGVLSVLSSSLRIMVPCLISGAYAFTTTRPSELVAALRAMHVPEQVIIPVLVVIRYFPTLRQECANISDAMRLRGIGTSPRELLAHPRSSVEHVLVPLLASASTTAEELSMACLTKGADNPGPHTCATPLHLRAVDAAFATASVGLLVLQIALRALGIA